MKSYKILLADDHVLFREMIRKGLEETKGWKVVGEAGDSLQLLELLKTVTPDLVILDISMPGMSGIEAVKEIKKTYPEVKILILTMSRSKEHIRHALVKGANGYIVKENAFADLITSIKSIQGGKSYLSPLVGEEVKGLIIDETLGEEPLSKPLTNREIEILALVAEGKTNREAAEHLGISKHTVKIHRARIMKKLNVKKSIDLVKYAISKDYISINPPH